MIESVQIVSLVSAQQLQRIQQMLDDQLIYQEENSLDILLRFSNEDQRNQEPDYFDLLHRQLPPIHNQLALTLPELDLFNDDMLEQPTPQLQLTEMKEACLKQEAKMMAWLTHGEQHRPQSLLCLRRKVSDCTEAPNSPLRKTKLVKKQKL